MKIVSGLLFGAAVMLSACASDQPKTMNSAPVAANPSPSAPASTQTATGNTFYTAPVTTPVR